MTLASFREFIKEVNGIIKQKHQHNPRILLDCYGILSIILWSTPITFVKTCSCYNIPSSCHDGNINIRVSTLKTLTRKCKSINVGQNLVNMANIWLGTFYVTFHHCISQNMLNGKSWCVALSRWEGRLLRCSLHFFCEDLCFSWADRGLFDYEIYWVLPEM